MGIGHRTASSDPDLLLYNQTLIKVICRAQQKTITCIHSTFMEVPKWNYQM